MEYLKSTVPGLTSLQLQHYFLKTGVGFLESRRKNDGAEGLWRIGNNLYDLEKFITNHPGGSEWIAMTKGTDITEAFKSHHISENPEKLLPKFFSREAKTPRTVLYTFESNGFYEKFKQRVREVLKNVDIHNSNTKSKLIADLALLITILLTIAVAIFKSWIVIAICGLFLCWTAIIGHNFFHLRDNFRMYYFDLSLMSSKEWRITHALSHHLYPNTLWDMEILCFFPFLNYLPSKNKTQFYGIVSLFISPIVFVLVSFMQAINRYYTVFAKWYRLEFRDIVPFFLPIIMSFFTSTYWEAIKLWIFIIMVSSYCFTFIGLTAAHHHTSLFHDGDVCRSDLDWGLMELDATCDRKIINNSLFFVLTNFGSHGLHHLLPALDHSILNLCLPAFYETCDEFGIEYNKINIFEMIKNHYQQLMRNKSRVNYRVNKSDSKF